MQNDQPSKMKRRDFVKKTGFAAGGLMMAPSILSAKAYAEGDDTIKVGLIGCGGRGTGAALQAMSVKESVKLVAMADAFQDRLESSYKQLQQEMPNYEIDTARMEVPAEHCFHGFDAYKQVIDLCDVVLIATPPGFRPTHFEAAVNAGKHVFMEKPLAVDGPGVRKVLETAKLAKKKKLNVVVGLQRHYQKKYQKWVDLLQEGVIGDITSSRVYWNSGGVWVRPRKPGQTEMEYQMQNWYYFNWLCGDHINEQHIHNLDVGNWVKQAYPVRASGMGGRQVRTGPEHGEIFDHHMVEYEYADGSFMHSQCRHIKGCPTMVTEAFHGTNGTAPKPGVILTRSGHSILDYNDRKDPNPYQYEHDLLFEAIANGDYKYEDAENGAKATLTAIMGRMATYSGQVIEWEDALNSDLSLMPEKLAWDANPKVMPLEGGTYPIAVPGETKVL